MIDLMSKFFCKFNPFAQARAAEYFEKKWHFAEVQKAAEKAFRADAAWKAAFDTYVIEEMAAGHPREHAEERAQHYIDTGPPVVQACEEAWKAYRGLQGDYEKRFC